MELELQTYNEYPEPTQIVIGDGVDPEQAISESTNKILGVQRIKRNLIGLKIFENEAEFISWQKQEPREIFEITPKIAVVGNFIYTRIFVSYNAGIIS
jgi:hypothetical protein